MLANLPCQDLQSMFNKLILSFNKIILGWLCIFLYLLPNVRNKCLVRLLILDHIIWFLSFNITNLSKTVSYSPLSNNHGPQASTIVTLLHPFLTLAHLASTSIRSVTCSLFFELHSETLIRIFPLKELIWYVFLKQHGCHSGVGFSFGSRYPDCLTL